MSRSGYSYDYDPWDNIRWRGQVASAIRGKRGQQLLREAKVALETMPEKRLVTSSFERTDGEVCTLGAVGRARGVDLTPLNKAANPDGYETPAPCSEEAGAALNIARQMAAEMMYENDEGGPYRETPEERHARMYRWVVDHIIEEPDAVDARVV